MGKGLQQKFSKLLICKWPTSKGRDVQQQSIVKWKLKTTMRYYLTPIRMNMTTILKKKIIITSRRKDVEKVEPWYTVGGTIKWYNHNRKHYGNTSKN